MSLTLRNPLSANHRKSHRLGIHVRSRLNASCLVGLFVLSTVLVPIGAFAETASSTPAVVFSSGTTFSYTGAMETFVVPSRVTELHVDVIGASGGDVSVFLSVYPFVSDGNGL